MLNKYTQTAKRYEVKMVLNSNQLTYLYSWMLINTTFRESFPPRNVNSIYFDDINLSSAIDNLSGISDRRKLRLRYYGKENYIGLVFEIKNKIGRLGYKNIFSLDNLLSDLQNVCYYEMASILHNHLIKDCDALNFTKYTSNFIYPMLKVTYLRKYYESLDGIRLTVDDNIKYRKPSPLDKVINTTNNLYNRKIVEIKFSQQQKNDVADLLRDLRLTPKRHSKYLTGLALYKVVSYV
jgi:hypothetical protein